MFLGMWAKEQQKVTHKMAVKRERARHRSHLPCSLILKMIPNATFGVVKSSSYCRGGNYTRL